MQGKRTSSIAWLVVSAALALGAWPCRGEEINGSATVGVRKADAAVESSAGSAPTSTAEATSSPHIEGGQVNGRWREGSRLIDQTGSFKLTGEHVTFISTDGKLKFDGLENLAIERVARTIGDSPDQLEWSISGLITEYRGSNYLLVTQAVLKTKAARARKP